ncbi:hypothetical protein LCGC14_2242810 [marine sediment metagenome]|uniref:Uncharacterized protein n=1 Tax=marine sediment metagenome TaxID=412755 RepID=A0A0F9DSI0_9ZZZZ
MDTDRKFPTEVIDLPSKGWFYDPDSPLASGQVELKYMTAREEDILTSLNLIQKGVVLDRLLKAVVVTPKVNVDDLLVGDKNGILLASRILAYGKDYPSSVACRKCSVVNAVVVDLTALDEKDVAEPEERGKNEFEFVLPTIKKTVVFRALTHGDDDKITAEIEAQCKISGDIEYTQSTRLKFMIMSVDGDATEAVVRNFVDNELISRDARALRQEYARVVPDVDLTFDFTCNDCKDQRRISVPLGIDFFWPIV